MTTSGNRFKFYFFCNFNRNFCIKVSKVYFNQIVSKRLFTHINVIHIFKHFLPGKKRRLNFQRYKKKKNSNSLKQTFDWMGMKKKKLIDFKSPIKFKGSSTKTIDYPKKLIFTVLIYKL